MKLTKCVNRECFTKPRLIRGLGIVFLTILFLAVFEAVFGIDLNPLNYILTWLGLP